MRYLPRALEATLAARLGSFPVVVLTGARQTGRWDCRGEALPP